MTTNPDHADDEPQSIWVTAGVDLDGTYRLTVEYNEDTAVTVDQPGAIAYATEVFTASAYAAYDAAVLAQMRHKLGLRMELAAQVVQGLRADRPPLNQDALGVLTLAPSVSAITGKPFLRCSLTCHGMKWQWNPEDADQHAGHVLQCYPVANLDNAYRQHLVGVIGIEPARAIAAVTDLANFRTGR